MPYLYYRTVYSFLASTLTINDLIQLALNRKSKYISICDINNLCAIPSAYFQAKQNDLTLIIGLEVQFGTSEILLFAKNNYGYQNLCQIATYLQNQTIANKTFTQLLKWFSDCFVVVKKCSEEEWTQINHAVPTTMLWVVKTFPFEVTANYINFPCVNCLNTKETVAILNCIRTSDTYNNYMEKSYDEQSWISMDDLDYITQHKPQFLDQTFFQTILDSCRVTLEEPKLHLQQMNRSTLENNQYLYQVCQDRLKMLSLTKTEAQMRDYQNRFEYEYQILVKKNLTAYFLLTKDYIDFAKQNNIIVGPGRGSAAGSLIVYLLGISAVDPLVYDLLFERFLNPARTDLPDIDVDLEDVRRQEVLNYLFTKYPPQTTAQIVTFNTLNMKSGIRDVGRVLEIPLAEINEVCKLITPLDIKMIDADPTKFDALVKKRFTYWLRHERYVKLFNTLKIIIGFPRHRSIHAAGMIISDQPISLTCPLFIDAANAIVTQYDMVFLEKLGFLKMDLLGLRNLSTIQQIFALVKKDFHFSFDDFNYQDQATYQLLASGDTQGLFQLESQGLVTLIKKINPHSIEDIATAISLYRPGPMRFIDEYIQNKQNNRFACPIPALKPILVKTHGVIIYQEQVMQIVQIFAGFNFTNADLLRRAMAKKQQSQMKLLYEQFVLGATKNGYDQSTIDEMFAKIKTFIDYGFNKSHAISYAFISYVTAFLKTHHRSEFYLTLFNAMIGNTEKIKSYLTNCQTNKISVLAPNINHPHLLAELTSVPREIRLGFQFIKQLRTDFIPKLLDYQEQYGKFESWQETFLVLHKCGCSKISIQQLIAAGSFDDFKINRSDLTQYFEKNHFVVAEKANFPFPVLRKIAQNELAPLIPTSTSTDQTEFELKAFGFELSLNNSQLTAFMHYQDKYQLTTFSDLFQTPTSIIKPYNLLVKVVKTHFSKKNPAIQLWALNDGYQTYPRVWNFTLNTEIETKISDQELYLAVLTFSGEDRNFLKLLKLQHWDEQ